MGKSGRPQDKQPASFGFRVLRRRLVVERLEERTLLAGSVQGPLLSSPLVDAVGLRLAAASSAPDLSVTSAAEMLLGADTTNTATVLDPSEIAVLSDVVPNIAPDPEWALALESGEPGGETPEETPTVRSPTGSDKSTLPTADALRLKSSPTPVMVSTWEQPPQQPPPPPPPRLVATPSSPPAAPTQVFGVLVPPKPPEADRPNVPPNGTPPPRSRPTLPPPPSRSEPSWASLPPPAVEHRGGADAPPSPPGLTQGLSSQLPVDSNLSGDRAAEILTAETSSPGKGMGPGEEPVQQASDRARALDGLLWEVEYASGRIATNAGIGEGPSGETGGERITTARGSFAATQFESPMTQAQPPLSGSMTPPAEKEQGRLGDLPGAGVRRDGVRQQPGEEAATATVQSGPSLVEGVSSGVTTTALPSRSSLTRSAVEWLTLENTHPDATAEWRDSASVLHGTTVAADLGAETVPLTSAAALPTPVADAAWAALAAGSGTTLVQPTGSGGGRSGNAQVAEESADPWSLLFAPALFAFGIPKRCQATILLVEHDEPTRDAFHVLLADRGYLVLSAGTGHDAWGVLRAPLAPIDLVLLDVHLPDVSGIMLYARLRELHPTLPVVVCSRGELDPTELAGIRERGAPYHLRKPIAQDQLLATVEAVLS